MSKTYTDSITCAEKKTEDVESTTRIAFSSKHVAAHDADITLKFMEKYDFETPEITPAEEKKLTKKVIFIILSLTAVTDMLLYADKATLSYASIFGLWEDTGLDQNKYNNSSTLFYVGYLIGQVNLIFVQKLPIGKVMTFVAFSWAVIIFLHCAAFDYQGIYALRFFLGFVEAIAVPILNTTMSQFLTASEKAATAPLFISTCVGVSIPVGFIAYGILYAKSSVPVWKLFFIIIGGCTFVWTIVIFFVYPNNPTDAIFLSEKEKVWVIRRVQRTTGSSIEQKVFKKSQAIEALQDPISWLFFFMFFLQQLANNLSYQQNLLFEGIGGINNLDSTLVSTAAGGFAAVGCFVATIFLFFKPNYTAFSIVFWTMPAFSASIAIITLPWDKKIALIAMLCLAAPLFGIAWMLIFSWNITTCSGYTKKIVRNGMLLIGYSIGNIISPQLWREKDGPRYVPAWIVQIVLSFFLSPMIALIIWYILWKRNKVRKQNLLSLGATKGFINDELDGEIEVDVGMLDLTDLENERFIYPL